MVILVDTDAGITGVGQGGSPDLIRNLARSIIGKNAFDSEMIWQAAYMDGFYSPGKERLHALGGIDLALWDIKGKALNAPLYQLFGGKAREHIELYATNGLPPGVQAAERSACPEGPRRGDDGRPGIACSASTPRSCQRGAGRGRRARRRGKAAPAGAAARARAGAAARTAAAARARRPRRRSTRARTSA